jgi:O-antigen ligase
MRTKNNFIQSNTRLYSIVWGLLFSIFVLINEGSRSIGNYTKTPLFSYYTIFGYHISIIEIICFCILFFIITRRLLFGKIKIIKIPMLLLIIVSIMCLFSAIRGVYRFENIKIVGLAEIKAILLFVLFFILSIHVFSYRNEKLIIYFPAVLMFIRLFYEIIIYNYSPYIDSAIGERAGGVSGGSIYLPIFIVCIWLTRNRFKKCFLTILVLFICSTAFLSKSRMTFFVVLVSSMMLLIYFVFKCYNRKLSFIKFYAIVGLILFVCFTSILFFVLGENDFFKSFLFWESHNIASDVSNLAHYQDIQRGIILIKNSPILGYGLGGRLPTFKNAVFSSLIHNEFLHFWVTFGILGMIFWVYIFIIIPIKSFKSFDYLRKNNISLKPEYFIIFILVPYIITKITVSPPFYFSVNGLFFVSIILAIQFNLINESKKLLKSKINKETLDE